MASTHRILVVEDERAIRDLIQESLALAGLHAEVASDGLDALNLLRRNRFDLLVLDLNLPKLDGLSLLQKLRGEGDVTPVLILSARSDRTDVTGGLRSGADDYLTKPFGVEELVLRVKAILRRTNPETLAINALVCGPIRMDIDRHQVTLNDRLVELSATEFNLLEALLGRAGKVVTKETLLSQVWGIDFNANTTVVDTYISYLRRKLHQDGFAGIKTVRGVGFQIVGD